MELSSSSYYADPKISAQAKEEFEADIRGKIEQVRVEQPMTGYRPLLRHLKRQGVVIGERKLRAIMAKFELQVHPKKRYAVTTMSDHDKLRYPNLIEEMTIDGPNQVWASDITYIRIENGFVYLAVIIDLFSRKIIGWQISKRIDSKLVVDALKMATARRSPPRGAIHHSDQGVQYLSDDYVGLLHHHGFYVSCSAKGNPYDNAWTESFMKTLKYNEVHLWNYKTILDVLDRVPYFIEEIYNKKRLHSSLDYQTPEEYEKNNQGKSSRPTLKL